MGNNNSNENVRQQRPDFPSRVTQRFKRFNDVTWDQFLDAVKEMNRLCSASKNQNGEFLCFGLPKNTAEVPLWRHTVSVLCFKLSSTKQIISCKKLNLEEFLSLYQLRQSSAVSSGTTCTPGDTILGECGDSEGKCCICMEAPNDVLLPCLHAFCLVCVTNEIEFRPQFSCPICKTRIAKPVEDSWEVPDAPEPDEVAKYIAQIGS